MLELEKTYLAKYLPEWLSQSPCKQIVDRYLPATDVHPGLRLRHHGPHYELTKKRPVVESDASIYLEETIVLSYEEYQALAVLPAKEVSKTRYYYPRDGVTYEVDVFDKWLAWLVVVEVEFATPEEKDAFQMPDFCLVDITQEDFIAWWLICGKIYADVAPFLGKHGYTALYL